MAEEGRLAYALGEFAEYADHQSWRCGHPDRYPWWTETGEEDDCPCGLLDVTRTLGLHELADSMLAGAKQTAAEREAANRSRREERRP